MCEAVVQASLDGAADLLLSLHRLVLGLTFHCKQVDIARHDLWIHKPQPGT
jgi:hypothetical protein